MVVDIIQRIRAEVPKPFCIALKINSTDYQGEAGIPQMIEHLSLFEKAGIDFLELSGGTYEDPQVFPSLFCLDMFFPLRLLGKLINDESR